jgi:hypothetical protein
LEAEKKVPHKLCQFLEKKQEHFSASLMTDGPGKLNQNSKSDK